MKKVTVNLLTIAFFLLYSQIVLAKKVDCGAYITTEYNVGLSAAIYVGVNISAKNTTREH